MSISVVVISGTLHSPSRTDEVVDAVVTGIRAKREADVRVIRPLEVAPQLVTALAGGPDEALRDEFDAIAAADIVVIGTPVYKGAYTGLLKLYVDFLDVRHLEGKPVVLVATGGSDQHSLVIEHELRPLVGFFRAHPVPVGVYASRADVLADGSHSERLAAAIAGAVDGALALLP